MIRPIVGQMVHYVSYGTPGGEYLKKCRAAVVAEVVRFEDRGTDDSNVVRLVVLSPEGLFFSPCPQDENLKVGGTWHWPEPV